MSHWNWLKLAVLLLAITPNAQAQEYIFVNGFDGTELAGRVLDTNAFVADGSEIGVSGATVRLLEASQTVTTDADGRFSLTGIPIDARVLDIDVSTANPAPNGDVYAGFRERIELTKGLNDVTRPFYLPRVDADSLTQVIPTQTTTVTSTKLGITLTVDPFTARDEDGNFFAGQLSISEVPNALAPAALPEDMGPGMLFTIQPVGVTFEPPAPISVANNIDNLPPGKRVDFWSLDPNRGVFTVVGVGEVSSDGSVIDTISGGVRAADWHAPIPPPPFNGQGPSDEPSDCDKCCQNCSGAKASGSSVRIADGELREVLALPRYVSLNQPRGLVFEYSSKRAYPKVVMTANSAIPADAPLPEMISYQGFIDGVDEGYEVFIDPTGLDPDIREDFRIALPLDGTNLPTGIYRGSARIRNHYPSSTPSTRINRNVSFINDRESPLGAGWRLRGLDRLFANDSGGVLLVDGAGNARQFFGGSGAGNNVLLLTEQVGNFIPELAADLLEEMGVPFTYTYGTVDVEGFPRADILDLDDALLVIWATTAPTCQFVYTTREGCTAFINLLTEARSRGISLLFLGDKVNPWDEPFGFSGRTALAEPELSTYEDLTRLLRQSEKSDETCFGCFPWKLNQPGHPIFVGPFGDTSGMDHGPIIDDRPMQAGFGESVLAQPVRDGVPQPFHPIITYKDPESGANVVTISNTLGFGEATELEVPARIVFKNAVDWLMKTSSQGQPGVLRSSIVDASTLTENEDGSYTRRMKEGLIYEFNADGLLTSTRDPNGNTVSFQYDLEQRLTRITDPMGKQTRLEYVSGKLSKVTDPADRETLFVVDANGDLTSITFPDGSTRTFQYDDRHLMVSQTDQRDFSTTYEFNSAGQFNRSTKHNGSVRELVPSQEVGFVDPGGAAGKKDSPVKIVRPIEARQ